MVALQYTTMRRNLPNLRVSCSLVLLVFVSAAGPVHMQAANELEQNLRSQYGDKTLVLRNFYPPSGVKLRPSERRYKPYIVVLLVRYRLDNSRQICYS